MNSRTEALPPGQATVLQIIMRRDGGGLHPVRNAHIQSALGTRQIYTAKLEALAKKGLVCRQDLGWTSTWAARLLVRHQPAALGLSAEAQLYMPTVLHEERAPAELLEHLPAEPIRIPSPTVAA